MGTICKIGESKVILGKVYVKKSPRGDNYPACSGCHFNRGVCPFTCTAGGVRKAIEDGGSECHNSIWKSAHKVAKKPKAKTTKHAWAPKSFVPNSKATKAQLEDFLRGAMDQINELGTENARLKNQIASLKKKGTK